MRRVFDLRGGYPLTDRYLYNEDFRQPMQRDPVGIAESTGLPLDDEDREAIRNWGMRHTGDEVLKDRVSKLAGTNSPAGI